MQIILPVVNKYSGVNRSELFTACLHTTCKQFSLMDIPKLSCENLDKHISTAREIRNNVHLHNRTVSLTHGYINPS